MWKQKRVESERSKKIRCLEEALERMDEADFGEIDSSEYDAMLRELVELRSAGRRRSRQRG